ncbi:MAG: hypothetical protein ABIF88_03460 [archaeon]
MYEKEIKIILSPEARNVYEYLNSVSDTSKIEKSILKAIKDKSKLIKENPQYGDPISKKLIPKEYIKKYSINNLFRVELPNYWRMLYSLEEGDSRIEIIAFVLEIMSHKKYNKRFGYKK